MDEQTTTRLGTTIHAYAVTASLPRVAAFRCYARYASLFAGGVVPVVADNKATRWKGNFAGPRHAEHVRDTMAGAAGAARLPTLRLRDRPAHPRGVLLCPHAGERFKEWPEQRWTALAEALLGGGLAVRACPEPGRAPLPWPQGVQIESLDLDALAARIGEAEVVVGPDSGHLHLADLLGTPVVGMYAATSAVTYGPYSDRTYCVDQHAEAFPAGRAYDSSIHLHGTPMQAITVSAVFAQVRRATASGNQVP